MKRRKAQEGLLSPLSVLYEARCVKRDRELRDPSAGAVEGGIMSLTASSTGASVRSCGRWGTKKSKGDLYCLWTGDIIFCSYFPKNERGVV